MKYLPWKSSLPYFVAIVLFLILSFVYFSPVLEDKIILGDDNVGYFSASKEARDYEEKTGEHALWTNAMFGGMPTYQITGEQPNNLIKYLEMPLKLVPRPVFFAFLYLLGGFLLLKMLGLNVWLSMAGAVAFAFASYNFIIIGAGHNTKAIAIAYILPLLGSIILAFRKNRWTGAVFAALFLALSIRANHLQILYYALFIIIIFFISEFYFSIKEKRIGELLKTSGVLAVAALLAIAANAGTLLTTYEYSRYTMRGDATGLTTDNAASQNGLEAAYITGWSYGIAETGTLMIPNFRGGASGGALGMGSATAAKIQSLGVPEPEIKKMINRMPLYWGTQPGTSGPVYIGAIVCFLFVMGLFLVESRYKWWLVLATVLSLLLAWGENFMPFTQFFIDYVPLYNKFRAVSMTLVIAGICMPVMGFMALKNIFDEKIPKEKIRMALLWTTGITGGGCLLFAILPSLAGSFVSPEDTQITGDFNFLQTTLPLDRRTMLSNDAWRSLAFIVLTAATLYFYLQQKLKAVAATAILGMLMLVDLWGVSKRYLNDDSFVDREMLFNPVLATTADKAVLSDRDPNFRVMNLTQDLWNDKSTSYFHKNIGGYSAAKMRRYQELIDHMIEPEVKHLYNAFQTAETEKDLQGTLQNLQILNMLNMRYLIYHPDAPPVLNTSANGNAWFVRKVFVANSADEEMKKLGTIDTKTALVVDGGQYRNILPLQPALTAGDTIYLLSYSPNVLKYRAQTTADRYAVFSEIYYSKGWRAFVDGVETPHFRANYVLRAMYIPAGVHTIEFRFEPASYLIGNLISLVASALLIVALLTVLGFYFYRKSKE